MKKYQVEIRETLIYKIEVEAENASEAEEKAFNSHEFAENQFCENDAEAVLVEEI